MGLKPTTLWRVLPNDSDHSVTQQKSSHIFFVCFKWIFFIIFIKSAAGLGWNHFRWNFLFRQKGGNQFKKLLNKNAQLASRFSLSPLSHKPQPLISHWLSFLSSVSSFLTNAYPRKFCSTFEVSFWRELREANKLLITNSHLSWKEYLLQGRHNASPRCFTLTLYLLDTLC